MTDDFEHRIPKPSEAWQLWHSDTFDRDAPLTLQSSGTDIIQGLYELWRYTLKEGILDDGNASFSRFHLIWGHTPVTRVDILVHPFNNPALRKLGSWMQVMSEEQEDVFVLRLAQLHYESLEKSLRWNASTLDWSLESREVLAHVEMISGPEAL